ncbi:hypothetical protein [Chlamydiifrater phoenicopteri]|uniref:hypothetical protein n=1 Tax=Chlamydiifrater phoenicopteri TaxID=2681469 RepID=UPI001BCB6A8C|nr:hypothetical protein [Chlamydiifrater phoenicopteri]
MFVSIEGEDVMASDRLKVLCSSSWGDFSASFGKSLRDAYESKKSKSVSKTSTVAASVLAAATGVLAHFGPELLFGIMTSSSATIIALSVMGAILALVVIVVVVRGCCLHENRYKPEGLEHDISDGDVFWNVKDSNIGVTRGMCKKKKKTTRRAINQFTSTTQRGRDYGQIQKGLMTVNSQSDFLNRHKRLTVSDKGGRDNRQHPEKLMTLSYQKAPRSYKYYLTSNASDRDCYLLPERLMALKTRNGLQGRYNLSSDISNREGLLPGRLAVLRSRSGLHGYYHSSSDISNRESLLPERLAVLRSRSGLHGHYHSSSDISNRENLLPERLAVLRSRSGLHGHYHSSSDISSVLDHHRSSSDADSSPSRRLRFISDSGDVCHYRYLNSCSSSSGEISASVEYAESSDELESLSGEEIKTSSEEFAQIEKTTHEKVSP